MADGQQGFGSFDDFDKFVKQAPKVSPGASGQPAKPDKEASQFKFAKPGPYVTTLHPEEEKQFQQWVKTEKIPWQDGPEADYDMRGYWRKMKQGKAQTKVDPTDHKPHYPDTWKTPYHKSFSNESMYALPNAPHWEGNKLVPTTGFTDFDSLDSFISDLGKKKKDAQQQAAQKPAKLAEVPFYTRPFSKWGERGEITPQEMSKDLADRFGIGVDPKDPRLHKIWKDTLDQIDPGNHPFGFLEFVLGQVHKGTGELAAKIFPTATQSDEQGIKVLQAALNDPAIKANPDTRKGLESLLNRAKDELAAFNVKEQKSGVSPLDPGVLAQTATTTFIDWEAMGSLFKPLEWASLAAKDYKAARTALYAVNQALGAKFSYDSFKDGTKLWSEGKYFEAMSAFGGSAAMLVMPLMHHVMSEKGITQEQIRQKANEVLEEKKKEVKKAAEEKPEAVQLITPKAIEDMQYRLANGLPMLGIGRPVPHDIPLPEKDVLNIGEQNLQNRLDRENAKTQAQHRVAELEREQRQIDHEKKIAGEQAKTEAEKKQLMDELDRREKALSDKIRAEGERLKATTAGLQRPEYRPNYLDAPPSTEKKPMEAEPLEIPPHPQPMTKEDREVQWLEERRRKYADDLRREADQAAGERERGLRAGEGFNVADKRRFIAELEGLPPRVNMAVPGEPEALTPTPTEESPTVPAVEALAPPPQTREEIDGKIRAAAWENQEAELRKAQAKTPEEVALIEQQQERNRQVAGDLAVNRATEALRERRRPEEFTPGEKLSGPVGKSSELKTVTRNYPIRYRVVEANSLRTSHDPINFDVSENYPKDVQERDYKGDADAQLAVIQHTQNYDPAFTLSDAPGPEHGPPMVTEDGVVLGGNSRAMSTVRLYREGGADAYREALMARASQLGIDPAEIEKMKEPVLIREFQSIPNDQQSLRALGSDLNRVFTRKLSEFEQAVSAGKRLSQETLDYILQQLTDLGDGASLRDLLRERSRGILEKLENDNVIAPTERRAFIDEQTQTLNEAGKDFVENAILGSVVDDPLVLANSPKSILRKIERSLSSLARIKARGGLWDITDYLKEALREHIAASSVGESIQDRVDPPTASMFAQEPIHPIVKGIALKLDESSADTKKAFENYAEDAEMDVKGQGTMAFFTPPKPWESFSGNFGIEVKPQEWGTVKAVDPQTRAAESQPPRTTSAAPSPLTPTPEERTAPPADLEAYGVAQFRAQAEKAFPNVDKEQMDAVMSILDARARATGKSLDQWLKDAKLSVEGQERDVAHEKIFRKKVKGGTKVFQRQIYGHLESFEDGRKILRAFSDRNPKLDTLVHELGHVFRHDLKFSDLRPRDWLALQEWAGVKQDIEYGSIWTTEAEEKFARGFERYLRDGKAPNEGLRNVFAKFKEWLTGIIDSLKGYPKITDEMRQVYDKMLGGTGEKVEPKPLEPVPEKKASSNEDQLKRNYAKLLQKIRAAEGEKRQSLEESAVIDREEIRELLGDPNWDMSFSQGDAFLNQKPEPPKQLEPTPAEAEPEDWLKKLPEGVQKKHAEPLDEPPRKTVEESTRAMSDEDLRSASKTMESQLARPGLSDRARGVLEGQFAPIKKELQRRNLLDNPEKGFGESNAVFTKSRAEAARERLRKKLGTTLYSGIDPEVVKDVSEIMGFYFEGGIREFGSLAKKVISEFGETIRPVLQQAYDQMLSRGKAESKATEQKQLFEPVKSGGIILPPGLEEVRRAPQESRREERGVPARERPDAGVESKKPERVGRPAQETPRSKGSAGESPTGRGVRPAGAGSSGGGVVEQFKQPLRAVSNPVLDVDPITTIPAVVDAGEWKGRLKDANLPENLPAPTETLSPQVDKLLAFKGQPEIVQTALTSLRKYNGAILATSTGTGKTYMGSAVLAETRPRYGLIVTPSQNIAKQWIDTAALFGVEIKPLEKDIPTEPGIYTTTYSTATNRKGLDKMNWNMVIADESHYARRWHDPSNQRGKFLVEVGKNSDKVLYTSATPFHTPLELGYFEKLGLWKKTGLENWLAREFGVRQGEDGNWIVPMNYRKLAALREELINRGMFVNLDRNMEGYSANFAVVPMSQETVEGVRNATQAFRMAEEYFKGKRSPKMVMAVKGNAATFMKSYLERQRLPEAIELGKKLENEGWKVIYFTESKKEVSDIYNFLKPADDAFDGAISRKLPRLPGVVDSLKEAFGDSLADFTGAHSSRRQDDLEKFNSGEKKHLVATYGAGGVGVSLHDLSGEAPRAVVYLGPPWSGVMFDQAIGRPWRFGTKSNVSAYFLTSNAQPEMRLIFQKVLPRFESLKASVSGIKKADPIVNAMKDLDAYLAYEFGNDTKAGYDEFMNTVPTSAVSSYKEASIVSAEDAKNKGMRVERRKSMDEPPAPPKLFQAKDIPPDLPLPEDKNSENEEKSASVIRRPFVSEGTEREVTDPRLLDQINDENMAALGIDAGGEKPPKPPGEYYGDEQINRPGEAEVRRDDLAAPKLMQRAFEFAKEHFGEWSLPAGIIDKLATVESNFRRTLAELRTSSSVLREFPETKLLADGIIGKELEYKRDLGGMIFEKGKILQEYNLMNDPIGRRKVDQALRMTDQGVPLMSLLGEPSKWLDGSVFKENELKAAQAFRDKIYEPIIGAVRAVRPDVGYKRKYSAVIRTMEDLVSTLYPDLNGKVPADLVGQFSLEIRRSMTKDPFSPHTLRRQNEPPKTWDIDDVMEAYLPGMLRVKHYTKLSRKVAGQLAELPDSLLKEYATKYARIFFGVPSEYKRMDRLKFKASRAITNLSYAAALELNPVWSAMHLTKVPVNTLPELGKGGAGYLLKALAKMRTDEGRELVARSGLLMDRLWAYPESLGYELKKRPQGWLRLTTSISDLVDRSMSYLAALEKAKDLGFLGPKEQVGEITWKRLNELAANGVDVTKALDYAGSVVSRSEFLYSPGNVQMWQREHPVLGMFKHFLPREIEFASSLRRIAKEVKAQPDPEKYIEEQVSKGNYEYVDAIAKYRRFLMSLTGAAAVAFGVGGPIFSRFWPFHLSRLLSTPVMFAADTVALVTKTLEGKAKEDEWKAWLYDFVGSFVPYGGYAARKLDPYQKVTITKPRKHPSEFEFDSFPKEKFDFEPLPQ